MTSTVSSPATVPRIEGQAAWSTAEARNWAAPAGVRSTTRFALASALSRNSDPTVEPRRQPLTYVPRPDSLQGKRIGLVENTKFNSDRLLVKIGEILKQEYGAAETRMWRKHNAGVPAHKEILDEARQTVDVVVAGIGD